MNIKLITAYLMPIFITALFVGSENNLNSALKEIDDTIDIHIEMPVYGNAEYLSEEEKNGLIIDLMLSYRKKMKEIRQECDEILAKLTSDGSYGKDTVSKFDAEHTIREKESDLIAELNAELTNKINDIITKSEIMQAASESDRNENLNAASKLLAEIFADTGSFDEFSKKEDK